jgi:hypothetical protein
MGKTFFRHSAGGGLGLTTEKAEGQVSFQFLVFSF